MHEISTAYSRNHYRGPNNARDAQERDAAPGSAESQPNPSKHDDSDALQLSASALEALEQLDAALSTLLGDFEDTDTGFPAEGSAMGRIRHYLNSPYHAQRASSNPELGRFYSALQDLQQQHRRTMAQTHQSALSQPRPDGYWSQLI